MKRFAIAGALLALPLSACGGDAAEGQADAEFVWPESVAAFGEGYPLAGDPCMRLGEAAATSAYLDDSAILVGCPTAADADALGGEIVGEIEGVSVVSVPMGDANVGMGENGPMAGGDDALVAGTQYNATSIADCGFDGAEPTQSCDVGIVRNWGEDGSHLVEITKPDGSKRAIFFEGTTPIGADSAEADGSAGWDFETVQEDDRIIITYGPESYVLVEAMITGG